jgi:hypothetical protein
MLFLLRCMALALIANLVWLAGTAEAQQKEDIGARGEFVRSGQAFACKVPAGQIAPENVSKLTDQVCLHLGSLPIWADETVVEPLFGKPDRVLPQSNGSTVKVFFTRKQQGASYFVITVQDHKIVAIQLSGKDPVAGYNFNQIQLGSSTDEVIAHLGNPLVTEPIADVPGSILWSYRPWTFSLEITADHVTSIRIADESAF